MNSFQLKIIGSFEIPEALDTTKDIAILVPATIYSAEKIDTQQNNEFIIRYKAKITGAAEIAQGTKKQVTKDPKKASQRLRAAIRERGTEEGVADDELWYQSEMVRIILAYNNNEV